MRAVQNPHRRPLWRAAASPVKITGEVIRVDARRRPSKIQDSSLRSRAGLRAPSPAPRGLGATSPGGRGDRRGTESVDVAPKTKGQVGFPTCPLYSTVSISSDQAASAFTPFSFFSSGITSVANRRRLISSILLKHISGVPQTCRLRKYSIDALAFPFRLLAICS